MADDKSSGGGTFLDKVKNFFSFVGMYSELMFFLELRRFRRETERALADLPKGDGHPVIVIPGLGADDAGTAPLRDILEKMGYIVYGWGLGVNRGPGSRMDVKLDELMVRVYRKHRRKVSLIGWSMGGIFAREMARNRPHYTRRVITLVSPFAADVQKHLTRWILQIFCQYTGYSVERTQQRLDRTRHTPPVLCTAIYSRRDAVVNWQACLEEDVPHAENVDVTGTHWGMVHNIEALRVVAHRLSLPDHQLN